MPKKTGTFVNAILESLSQSLEYFPRPFETPYAYIRRTQRISYGQYRGAVYNLRRRGVVELTKKGDKQFLTLTQKGQLESLFIKARLVRKAVWDRKWRVIMFDIPEQCRLQRNQLRHLLRLNSFYKLQASVFISPYVLNKNAIVYLKAVGLIEYIRILRVDELDDDRELRRHFKLM